MTTPIIKINNISKKYDITHQQGGYVALRDVITNAFKNPLKFAKHKAKKVLGRISKEEFWALKDINLTINKGEVIGIIGSNGAGKSTLLKILSQITFPTTGEIEINGRVASLLEVGTGFHPELTGRENIFLNGAIIGMTTKEIIKKFDQIIEFAGVQKFIDTPVKRYSSGMYVRLAFSVAAHMEPDVLLVDEVLAVGDTAFQKKCLGKMDEVTKTAGRTILFVSHNMEAVKNLCHKCVLLENGEIKMFDETEKVITRYLQNNPLTQDNTLKKRRDRKGGEKIRLTSFHVEDHDGKKVDAIRFGGKYSFCFGYESLDNQPINNLGCAFSINKDSNQLVFNWTKHTKQSFDAPPKGILKCQLKQKMPLGEGLYDLAVNLWAGDERVDYIHNLLTFEIKKGDFYNNGVYIKSPVHLEQDWSLNTG
ncbi:hypothetical protein A2331_02760 [Candidatus Falkowbacteria bacterium RIFOXYB2_FULL_34_18]|uniref:ABC transporter domain-containing protein n=1 Tax=Candidatus Falkowbacteria bacterium RIFOXYD2_FULL_34_120 TaxID=1798007 RepID=A0A1F5TRR0_9BACT|nr:MAG: hypothetical protein A2331_02760 [Candidatus Falkowbacteria bacterium RIFOXYB2_FULL_34_18]OGF29661.1 MAG: hypothetical protein A2500_00790 [Candidatus Falkowbacteria bacterium RIFOXYC12_FULL_34_55]OGF37388.1 MAG: hypothetical protein A2466_01560 [Candidatus Falkowbacteria bacterium RIFOXYC2_FULL_34_220]OGF39126.1 MAG: hypothetical protein A2515_00210 [Candidatus Falkowbacteria bacterium RIFOXYD12_FULL_34_57]OGF41650.1 MAG: hypothetical protein A2531_06445 [Candidatus Falkowbacteria bact